MVSSTKRIFNQEMRPLMTDSPYLPSHIRYTWVDDNDVNFNGFLRDQKLDMTLVTNYNH